MGRKRLRQSPASAYITSQGKQKLVEELDYLWRVKRPQVTQAVADAAALGDRSENAEYIYGKKQLREIDRRVRYLQKRFDDLQVVSQLPDDQSKIYFGAWVTLEDVGGKRIDYRIVGPDEFDLDKGYLSMDAPLARLLLGKSIDDIVELCQAESKQSYTIVAIRYESDG